MVYLALIYSVLIWAVDLSARLLSLISHLHFAESL